MQWLIVPITIVLYVASFIQVANQYFDSDKKMVWRDLYKDYVPGHMKITVEL